MDRIPYIRTIGVEDLMAFDPDDRDTFTPSDLVNQTLRACLAVSPLQATQVAACLRLPRVKLSGAMEILTGKNLAEVVLLMRIKRLRQAFLSHSTLSMDEIARQAGMADRFSADHLMKNPKYRKYFADLDMKSLRPHRYYK